MSKRSTRTGRGARSIVLALAGQLVQPPAADLQRRHHRRNLFDLAEQVFGDQRPRPVEVNRRSVVDRGDGAVSVERVGLHAEDDLARVALAPVGDEAQQAGDHADADDEHPGGPRVEGAGVADAPFVEAPPQLGDDVVARDARWLVDDRDSVDRRRTTPSHRRLDCSDHPIWAASDSLAECRTPTSSSSSSRRTFRTVGP